MSELIEKIDSELTYGGARKISDFEAELLDQIDESYDAQIKMQRELDNAKRTTKGVQDTLKKIDDAINEYCSETTRNKILLSRGWQFMPEKAREIEEALSDKEIVEQKGRDLEENAFSSGTIGKATIGVSTALKDQSKKQTEKDVLEYEELSNGQGKAKND